MKKVVYFIILIFCLISSVTISYSYVVKKYSSEVGEAVPVESFEEEIIINPEKTDHNKLMIVAHPDDDAIWGGGHLIEDDYTVVCVTCGVVKLRLDEFISVMEFGNDNYIYLSHTDLEPGAIISDWTYEKDEINEELKHIIESRDWDLIVTHNPEGEYGHKHHKMISKMVTDNVIDKDKLYYFGKFYKKGTVDDSPTLKEETYLKKKEMLALYKSQPACTDKGTLTYAFNHENWVLYKDWK